MEYSFSNKRWLTSEEIENGSEINNRNALGLHPPGFYDRVVAIDYCHLQDDLANAIRNFVSSYTTANQISYYDIQEHLGIMRSLVIRQGTFSNQIMVNVIFGEANDHIHDICQAIQDHFPAIQSINYCINTKWNDSTWDLDFHTFHGPGYIEEVINHRTYRIGPKSFFQTNSYQARNMFDQIKAYADQEPYAILYDLYCGAGSIGIYLADQGKTIIGIEEVDEAIGQAKENQKLNHLSNCSFYQGDVKLLMNDQLIHEHGKADLIIVDPPRAGLHAEVVHALLQIQAPRIIYVSCNPATQARDLKILQEKYNIIEHQPIDMFPHTHHTENITLLKIK